MGFLERVVRLIQVRAERRALKRVRKWLTTAHAGKQTISRRQMSEYLGEQIRKQDLREERLEEV